MGRRILSLVFVLVIFSLPLVAASPWIEVRSQHVDVATDTSEKQGQEVARRLELMREVFGDLFSLSKLNTPAPLQIVAFRSQDEFMPYVPRQKGTPVSLDGFLVATEDSSFLGLDVSSPDWQSGAARSYARLLLRENFPVMPVWFEEGFAQYFGAVKTVGQQLEFGNTPAQLQTTLASSQWTPIATVFGARREDIEKQSAASATLFQAESWLAVRYILVNNRLGDAFKYLQLAQIQHVPPAEAIEQVFGVDAPNFEKQLRQSLSAATATTRSPIPPLHDEPYSTKKVTDMQAHAVLADMHAHSDQFFQQALPELQAVLKADANNRVANRALGYWYLHNDQPAQAEPPLQRATSSSEVDEQSHYLLGAVLLKREEQEGRGERLRLTALQQLQRSIDIDREFAAPRSLLAEGLIESGNYDAGITSAKQAVALYPGAEQFQAQLARVYIQAERWDSARAVLIRLQTSEDPGIRQKATETLASLEATRQQAAEKKKEREAAMRDPTAPQWKMTQDIAAEDARDAADDSEKPDTRKTMFLSGELQSIDCSHQPAAFVTVRKNQKTVRLYTNDYTKLIVTGADQFSCSWRDKRVVINYKPGGHADGDLVSLELAGK